MTDGSLITLDWEMSRKEKAARRAEQREIRRALVKPDCKSRPASMSAYICRKVLKVEKPKRADQERADAIVEKIFVVAEWLAWIIVVGLVVADLLLSNGGARSIVYGHTLAGIVVAIGGALLLVMFMLELGSYRPRLFAQCQGRPDVFFESLADLSSEMDDHVTKIANERPKSWRLVKELEQSLIAESSKFIFPDGIRTRVTLRVLRRLAGLVAALALLGYGLSAATNGDLLATCPPAVQECVQKASAVTLPEHFYFSVVAFFTGFGDIQLVHDLVGYGYLMVIVASFTAVVYFFLTDVVSSQAEFRANMLAAAESYILQQSRL
jgi:hypothetical protein